MKYGKDIALIMLGVGLSVAYQKYSKPVAKKVEDTINKSKKQIANKMENMM